jgi:fucose permease
MKIDQIAETENGGERGLFVTGGKNLVVTFCLVSSLFLLWGFCNGMIDVMDKHFQDELRLSLSQSAWVQFAHYLGYFLMSLPAGWLAMKLGYKGGIIAGLLMVSVGGFWFVPATNIQQFWAFLLGVCTIASGLTFLETIANPYTTVLGPRKYAATRINLAQSCNGVGWPLGPYVGGLFFYGTDKAGRSTGAENLWIPYAGVGVFVLLLAIGFFFAYMPDIQTKDEYGKADEGKDEAEVGNGHGAGKGVATLLLLANVGVLIGIVGMILWLALDTIFNLGQYLHGIASAIPHPSGMYMSDGTALALTMAAAGVAIFIVVGGFLVTRKHSHESIWSHPHFSGATLAQFFYVAAQAGIFSFLLNYMIAEPPSLPASWLKEDSTRIAIKTTFAKSDFKDLRGFVEKLNKKADPLSKYLMEGKKVEKKVRGKMQLVDEKTFSEPTLEHMDLYLKGAPLDTALRVEMGLDLNSLIGKESLYTPERFAGVTLGEETKKLLSVDYSEKSPARFNRLLLADAYPNELSFTDGIVGFSNQFAAFLASVGFFFFLGGRVIGSGLLAKFSAHKIVGLYGVLNVIACLVVVFKLGWLSVACVFLSYFFMSIMFPTIFALGIFGLGSRAKRASAYIVMAIMGGAILPKIMGAVADNYDLSRGFLVPMVCFAIIALYGFGWPKLSGADSLRGVKGGAGH